MTKGDKVWTETLEVLEKLYGELTDDEKGMCKIACMTGAKKTMEAVEGILKPLR